MAVIFVTSLGIAVPWSMGGTDTRTIWVQNCASCHGKDGSGSTSMGKKLSVKDYRDPALQAALNDAEAERAIKEGVKTNVKETMKPFGSKFFRREYQGAGQIYSGFQKVMADSSRPPTLDYLSVAKSRRNFLPLFQLF
jgi:mono/diheme cytochrome c family protein